MTTTEANTAVRRSSATPTRSTGRTGVYARNGVFRIKIKRSGAWRFVTIRAPGIKLDQAVDLRARMLVAEHSSDLEWDALLHEARSGSPLDMLDLDDLDRYWLHLMRRPETLVLESLPTWKRRNFHRAGVYFLVDQGEIVYVGMSYASIYNRVGSHMSSKNLKRFDRIAVILNIPVPLLSWIEAVYIEWLAPRDNVHKPCAGGELSAAAKRLDEWLPAQH